MTSRGISACPSIQSGSRFSDKSLELIHEFFKRSTSSAFKQREVFWDHQRTYLQNSEGLFFTEKVRYFTCSSSNLRTTAMGTLLRLINFLPSPVFNIGTELTKSTYYLLFPYNII